MKRTVSACAAVLLLAGAGGCFSFNTTEYPTAPVVRAPSGRDVTVAVNGFHAELITYVGVSGARTIWVPGYCGRHYCSPGYFETVPTTEVVEQLTPSDVFRRRARDAMEEAGYVVGARTPDWTVEADFAGPYSEESDGMRKWGWMLCTVFFCDYAAAEWRAKLKIRDNRTGRLVFSHDFSQRFETNAFGLIPLFGIASCEKTRSAYVQSWCLGALTDRVVAEASAFLANAR